MQQFLHYFLHVVFPVFVAIICYKKNWVKTTLILWATMLVDLDHVLATPVFDPCRCSIGFHPLHSYIAIAFYSLLVLHPKTRIAGIGLLLHMCTDGIDCLLNSCN